MSIHLTFLWLSITCPSALPPLSLFLSLCYPSVVLIGSLSPTRTWDPSGAVLAQCFWGLLSFSWFVATYCNLLPTKSEKYKYLSLVIIIFSWYVTNISQKVILLYNHSYSCIKVWRMLTKCKDQIAGGGSSSGLIVIMKEFRDL